MKKRGFVIILSLFIVVTLSIVGIYFVALTQLGTGSSTIFQQDILIRFSTDSTINIGYSKLLSSLYEYNFLLPYNNEVIFHGEDINMNGKLDDGEDTIMENGLIDTYFQGTLDIYSKIPPSIYTKEYTLAKYKVKPSYIIEKDNLYISIFLKIIDTSSRFNLKNASNQILNNISSFIKVDKEILETTAKDVKNTEYGWFSKLPARYHGLYNLLTIFSYTDDKIVKSVDYSNYHKKNIYSVLELYPKTVEFESFSPVNINTANFDVLYNLFNGLKGYYFKPANPANSDFPQLDSYHKKRQKTEDAHIGTLELVEINDLLAKKIAEDIITLRKVKGSIKDLNELENFLLSHNIEKNIVDLIFANCNSSLHTYKYNTPYFDNKTVDRLQIVNPTTTVWFIPTGTFEFFYDVYIVNKISSKVLFNYSDYSILKLYDIEKLSLDTDFKHLQISSSNQTLNKMALSVYPNSKYDEAESAVFDSYLGSSVLNIYDKKDIEGIASFSADFLGDIKPKIAEGDAKITISPKNFPKNGKLYGNVLNELGNIFDDGVYIDNFSTISFNLAKNLPPPGSLELYKILSDLYNKSLLAEVYNLAQSYVAPVRTANFCISSYIKPNRFLNEYKKPRVLFNVIYPITKDYNSYVYFFSFLYPQLQGQTIKPKVFVNPQERTAKEAFINFGDTAALAQLYGIKKGIDSTIFDGIWHNLAFCISNTNFENLLQILNKLGEFDVKIFTKENWLYGPKYYNKVLEILNVSTKYVKIYVDGQEITESITFSPDLKNLVSNFLNIWKAEKFEIGSNMENPVWNYPLDGSLSHFTIWKKILQEDEIKKFLMVNKYYNKSFDITFKNSDFNAVFFNMYSKEDIIVNCNNCKSITKTGSTNIAIKNTTGKNFSLEFKPPTESTNDFIMIDNITLIRILPLQTTK